MSSSQPTPDQQQFFDLWNAADLQQLPPTSLAEQGGRLADRAAWVFVAAYQGAMRQCFPQLRELSGWASYLVSEARDESGTPTCTVEHDANGLLLNGHKNWVAAASHLQWLVVNASNAEGATSNLLVAADAGGVSLPAKPSGRFLPELAVGRAEFAAVALAPGAELLDATTRAPLFGLIEARCLLVALAAHFAEQAPAEQAPAEALLLAGGLVTTELGQRASIEVLLSAMQLLSDWLPTWLTSASATETPVGRDIRLRWADDVRLVSMHRPILEKRLQAS